MNKLDLDYQNLLKDILENGVKKEDRTGTGTISLFGKQIRYNMKDGFPLLTTKKMPFKTMVTELLWILRGSTRGDELVRAGCNIWVGDMFKAYIGKKTKRTEKTGQTWVPLTQEEFISKIKSDDKFAIKWGELGPIYGAQWRSWRVGKGIETTLKTDDGETIYEAGSIYIDQIQNLINDLKTNPDSRRLMVNAWNVGELDQMVLPPCHYGFQVYTRKTTREEKITNPGKYRAISLMWNQRSVDTALGLPFNIASYALLLEIIAKEVKMVPDELIGNLGDVHLYSNHIEGAKEQITRESYLLPQLKITKDVVRKDGGCLPHYEVTDFTVANYQSHPTIKFPLSN